METKRRLWSEIMGQRSRTGKLFPSIKRKKSEEEKRSLNISK
jgi:hypothetical protein